MRRFTAFDLSERCSDVANVEFEVAEACLATRPAAPCRAYHAATAGPPQAAHGGLVGLRERQERRHGHSDQTRPRPRPHQTGLTA